MSVSLTPAQTESFFAYGSDYTGDAVHKLDTIPFDEGNYCI